MKCIWWNNGLTIVLMLLFLGTWVGQAATGMREYNNGRRDHGRPSVGTGEYLRSGHFWEVTAENWESEFLQMAMFVILTCRLYKKGSPESKDPDEAGAPVDADPASAGGRPDAPWPVRRGGVALWLYSYSLSLTFLAMFAVSV